MKLKVNQCIDNCSQTFTINDVTGFGDDGFIYETDVPKKISDIKISDVVFYSIVKYKHSVDQVITNILIKEYTSEEVQKKNNRYNILFPQIDIPIKLDGWYELTYMIVPKKEKFIDVYDNGYYSYQNKIYNSKHEEVSFNELNSCYTNIIFKQTELFSLSNIRNTYLNYIYKKLYNKDNQGLLSFRNNYCNTSNKSNDILLSSIISTITYLIESCRYLDAQILIEEISKCNDIYVNDKHNVSHTKYNCGC